MLETHIKRDKDYRIELKNKIVFCFQWKYTSNNIFCVASHVPRVIFTDSWKTVTEQDVKLKVITTPKYMCVGV